ncbi:MAG: AAA family ATPase [Bacteroidetes bacterium]|nr:AAA family ATPase [Bacteroidota bacterium]
MKALYHRGLVIGKFMPVHQGHLTLIHFAASHCEQLIVSMSYTSDDPIPSSVRAIWLIELLKPYPNITVEVSLDDFDDPSLPLAKRTKIWADFIRKRFPPIDLIVSSEQYGAPFAAQLGAAELLFDMQRTQFPISATQIRNRPLYYWDYIPEIVQPYFLKKICFYGPESTGKSSMAKRMAEIYQTEFVPEVAREIVDSNDFTLNDIIRIGKAQTERVLQKAQTANRFLFCDTDLITTEVYCRHYLKEVPDALYELEKQIQYDAYFLFEVDVPWVADGLRDLGDRRKEMFDVFKSELDQRKINYHIVSGTYAGREAFIREKLDQLI